MTIQAEVARSPLQSFPWKYNESCGILGNQQITCLQIAKETGYFSKSRINQRINEQKAQFALNILLSIDISISVKKLFVPFPYCSRYQYKRKKKYKIF